MRLVNRLILSHAILAVVLVAALGVMLATLGDIHSQVREVRERDLAAIDQEEQIHRAAWAIEVTARHGSDACEAGIPELEVESTFLVPKTNLESKIREVGANVSRPLRETAQRYVTLTEDLIRGDTCKQLDEPGLRDKRLKLDEDMTNAWIGRLYELHGSLGRKEDAIVRSGKRALYLGSLFGVIALIAAWVIANRIARGVTEPLASLAQAASRVGRGDFSPIPDGGGPLEVIELTRDLDRMRAHLAELDALKQQFLASVSHELRTPLGKIREALALLGDGTAGTLSDRQKSVIEIAQRSCETEIRLVSTLLDLSRLRAGTLLQKRAKAVFDDALREAISSERPDANARSVAIDLTADGTSPPAELDAPLVERALANLIRNAVSVSAASTTVEITRLIDGENARVRVRDHGPGIPPEIRETIFEPFASKEVPGRRGGVGIGLGLAFAREVVRAHGGDIVLLDPTPGHTTFELWMPLTGVTGAR